MKQTSFLLIITVIFSLLMASCSSDQQTYAEQLKAEKALIADYIKRNNIKVLHSFPSDKKWGENDYVLTSTGLYYHLVDSGEVDDSYFLEYNDEVVPRYKEYTLKSPADTTTYNWTVQDYPDPRGYIYTETGTDPCVAFQEAFRYMKYNNSVAKIIVPSKLGFNTNDLSSATPYGYILKIKISK